MTTDRTLLLIADIGGYTDYMRTHRMTLAHAEVNTARLLSSIVDAASGFDLVEVEGDAAFMARSTRDLDADALVTLTLQTAVAMHRAFHVERQYVAANLCPCDGCAEAQRLRLKFVAHVGEVATQTLRQRTKLVGIDVILLHRLLKTPMGLPEYVLLSDELHSTAAQPVPGPPQPTSYDLEGIGPVTAWHLDVTQLQDSLPALPSPTLLGRWGRTLAVAGVGLPYMLGLRRRRYRGAAPED
jgi:hypothetical protein